MKEKTVKIVIILAIVLLVIVAILLWITLSKKEAQIDQIQEETPEDQMEILDTSVQEIDTFNRYIAIKKSISTYFANIPYKSKKILYNLIDQDMREKQNITEENILDKITKIQNENPVIDIDQMHVKEDADYPMFFVSGTIFDISYQVNYEDEFDLDIDYRKVEEKDIKRIPYQVIVRYDVASNSYSIEEVKKDRFEKLLDETEQIQEKKITQNAYNKFCGYSYATDEEVSMLLLKEYEMSTLLNRTKAYQTLDKTYQKTKFATENDYQSYLQERKNRAGNLKLNQYQVTRTDEYTQYICLDPTGNYYIFRVKSPTDYTVILDTYTVDLPEVVEQYKNKDVEGKMQVNLIKIFNAINDGDFRYAYLKLNADFRNKNFPTQKDFENYIKTNFYEKNTVDVSDFQSFDYVYRMGVNIRNQEQPNATYSVKKTFSMSFGDGTDFEYSFNVE